ncbi:winged helix-turn-helix transcriptional regulator [Streptomyces sp. NPDC093568]|uniref:winged helix-turn-helix transcriptional regulator n=1 Tax=Streptomyces sp. NPDC093568 TaxID=3366041 RepID=UPI0037F1B023
MVGELAESGAKRSTALRRKLEGVREKMLTQTLRGLERDGEVRGATHGRQGRTSSRGRRRREHAALAGARTPAGGLRGDAGR